MSLIAGVVDVEPRRVGVLMPFLALGAACTAWSVAHRRSRLAAAAGVAAVAVCVAVWAIRLPTWISAGLAPTTAHTLLVACRLLTTSAVAAWLIWDWRSSWQGFRVLPSALVIAAVFALIAGGELRNPDWRGWTTTIDAPIRQHIDRFSLDPARHPWLVVDFPTQDDAAAAAIYLNGRLIKAAGARTMRRWQADGGLVGWRPYADLRGIGAGIRPHTWLALPLDRRALVGHSVTIEVRPQRPIKIEGDYLDAEATSYPGPALTPWFDGFSLWRWLANGRDPRIAWRQPLDGTYSSDRRVGLYRIYIVQELFGPHTNVLDRSLAASTTPTARCRGGSEFATTARVDTAYLCAESQARLGLYSSGVRIGAVLTASLSPSVPSGTVVGSAVAKGIRVTVTHVAGPLFVADFTGRNGRPIYSLGFSYPATPPVYP